MSYMRALIGIALFVVIAATSPVLAQVQNNVRIGGAVYSLKLGTDGIHHLSGYACNKEGTPEQQKIHPRVEVYRDAPVKYGLDDTPLPGSGTLLNFGNADQAGSTQDEAKACDY